MTSQDGIDNKERRAYRVLLLLFVALAVLTSVMKDLDRLQDSVAGLGEVAASWSRDSRLSDSADGVSLSSCPQAVNQFGSVNQSIEAPEDGWSEQLAQSMALEIKGFAKDAAGEELSDSEVQVSANKHSRHSRVEVVANRRTRGSDMTLMTLEVNEFPGMLSRKQLNRIIENGGRELVLKTLNGTINLRRAG